MSRRPEERFPVCHAARLRRVSSTALPVSQFPPKGEFRRLDLGFEPYELPWMTALAGGDLCETGTTVSNRFCPDVLSNQVADFLSFILGHFICHIIVYEHLKQPITAFRPGERRV